MRPFLISLFLIPTTLAADLPVGGTCRFKESPGFEADVTWQGDRATIHTPLGDQTGRVVGLRPLGAGFKASFVYTDPFTGPREAMLFSASPPEDAIFRLGIVGYETTTEGQKVLSFIAPIQQGKCALY